MWVWILMLAPAEATCARTTSADEVAERLDTAEATLAQGELTRFEEDLTLVELAVQCVSEPVLPEVAARLHRFWGIRAYANDERAVAASHFRAARAIEPEEPLPVYPAGHPIQDAYQAASEPLSFKLSRPGSAPVYVDGTDTLLLDASAAHLLQVRQPDTPQLAYYPLPAGARPPWMPAPRERRSSLEPVLLGAGAASLLAAAGLGIGNAVSGQGFVNAGRTSEADLRKRQRTTNALAVATGATGVLGVGLVVGGVLAPGAGR